MLCGLTADSCWVGGDLVAGYNRDLLRCAPQLPPAFLPNFHLLPGGDLNLPLSLKCRPHQEARKKWASLAAYRESHAPPRELTWVLISGLLISSVCPLPVPCLSPTCPPPACRPFTQLGQPPPQFMPSSPAPRASGGSSARRWLVWTQASDGSALSPSISCLLSQTLFSFFCKHFTSAPTTRIYFLSPKCVCAGSFVVVVVALLL